MTPNWLKSQFPDLVSGKKFEAQLLSGPTPAFRFTVEGVAVDPWNGKLILAPIDNREGILDYIQKLGLEIFGRLPHTPIAAVGHNFAYELEDDETFDLSHLDLWRLRQQMAADTLSGRDDSSRRLQAEGLLAHGHAAEVQVEKIKREQADWFEAIAEYREQPAQHVSPK